MTDSLPCTLCIWEGADTTAKWRAKAPNKTYHYLCDKHFLLHEHKYSDKHILSPTLIARLLSGSTLPSGGNGT